MATVRLPVSAELYASPGWRLPAGFVETKRVDVIRDHPAADREYMLTVEGPFPASVEGVQVSACVYQQDSGRPDLWVWTYRGAAILDPIPMPPTAKAA